MAIQFLPLCDDRGALLVLLLSSAWDTDAANSQSAFFNREATDVHADFGQNDQGRSDVDSLDFCQVHAQCLEQRARRLEADVIAFAATRTRLTGPSFSPRPVRELRQFGFNLLVALGDLPMMEPVP